MSSTKSRVRATAEQSTGCREPDEAAIARREMHSAICLTHPNYEDTINRLRRAVRGAGHMDAAYLERLGVAFRQIGAIISLLDSPRSDGSTGACKMSWQDTTIVSLPIRAMGVTPSGQPMPLVALADVIKLLESYGVEVVNASTKQGEGK